MMKMATVYRRGAVIVIHPSSRTTDGVWILTEPCVRLPTDCLDAELGNVILSALEGSKSPVPHPKQSQWDSILEPLLNAAGVKTWKTFVKGVVCVEVEQHDGQLDIIPTVNLGHDGFQADDMRKRTLTLPTSSDVVGSTLRGVFAPAQ